MATPGEFLVGRTVINCNDVLDSLENTRRLVTRITERMEALGIGVLAGYQWPEGYTQADFVALYQALDALNGLIVENDVRDKLFKLIAYIQ